MRIRFDGLSNARRKQTIAVWMAHRARQEVRAHRS